MVDVVFAVPFSMDATLRFVRAVAALPQVRLGIVSQEPAERLPPDLRQAMHGFARVTDALEPVGLEAGVRQCAQALGGRIDRLLGILEPLQEPMGQVRQRLGLPGMTAATAHNFRDKAQMKDVLRAAGVPCAAHALCETPAAALAAAKRIGFPMVVKPPAGAGAKNTFRVERIEELESYVKTAPPSPSAPILLEEFLVGEELSFDSICVDGRHLFSSISRYFPTPLEVMREPWIQWAVMLPRSIDGPEFEAIHQVGPEALSALGMGTGMTHMEWFQRADGSIAVSEVAARPPGAQFTTLMSYAHDIDFYRAWAELSVFDRFEVPTRSFAAGAAFLRGQGRGRVHAVHGIEQVREQFTDVIVEAKLPESGQPGASSYEGEGYVIVRHPETEVVERALHGLVSSLRVELREDA